VTEQLRDLPPDSVPRKRLDARVRNYRNRILVAGPRDPFELTDTAAFIWRLIDGQRSISDLAEAVCAEYQIDHQTAVPDVAELIATLAAAGVLSH
jgi:hypothetical protein